MAVTAAPPRTSATMKFTYTADAKPVGGYTIRRGIHRGGFGEVYYAVSDAGKEVALKLLTHDLETELRGIRQCLNLKHSNLITIFDVRQDAEGDTWVIMEYVHGASLQDVLAAFPMGLPINEVRDWMDGLFAGIDYLHDRGLVHRDLKPGNVYRENGVVKIGDVGLSKQMGGGRRQHTEAIGTVYYMAPEVARGQYGVEVDVYSLGVMLYEMLTGRLPFDGETTAEILMKHLSARADLTPLPPALRPVIAHALEKDPQKRTSSVKQFAVEFRRAMATEPLPESAFLPPPLPNGSRPYQTERPTQGASARETPHAKAQPRPGRKLVDEIKMTAGEVLNTVLHPEIGERVRQKIRRDVERSERKSRRQLERQRRRQVRREVWAASGRSAVAALCAGLAVLFMAKSTGGSAPRWVFFAMLIGGFVAARQWWRSSRQPSITASFAPMRSTPILSGPITLAEQWSQSTLVAAAASVILTIAAWGGLGQLEGAWLRLQPQDLMHVALVTFCGAMSLVTMSQFLSHQGRVVTTPSWLSTAVGAGVGGMAFALDQFLMVRGFSSVNTHSVFDRIGPWDVWQNGHPTAAAYVVFFATLVGLQDWAGALAPQRTDRWRMGLVAWSGLIGFLASLFFGVPQPFAILWAVTISLTAQLAAPWQPRGLGRGADGDAPDDDSGSPVPVGGGDHDGGRAYATAESR
jgi:serine/threonine protein kinase